jgi:HEAT repeat protein
MAAIGVQAYANLLGLCSDAAADSQRRAEACFLLGELRLRSSVSALLKVGASDNSPEVVWAALCAVGAVGSRRATRALVNIVSSELSPVRRRAAVFALFQLADNRARQALIRAACDASEEHKTRGLAAEALGLLKRTRYTSGVLVRLLSDPSGEVRFGSLCGLAVLRERSAVPTIRALVSDRTVVDGTETVGDRALLVLRSFDS